MKQAFSGIIYAVVSQTGLHVHIKATAEQTNVETTAVQGAAEVKRKTKTKRECVLLKYTKGLKNHSTTTYMRERFTGIC